MSPAEQKVEVRELPLEPSIDDIARDIVDDLDTPFKVSVMINPEQLKIDRIEGLEFSAEELAQIEKRMLELIEEEFKTTWFFRTRSFHPLLAHYEVFGDTNDPDALLGNLEACGATSILNYVERKCFVFNGFDPLGIFYVHIARWQTEAAEAAFRNYQRRMLWEGKDFCEVLKNVLHNR